MQDRSLAPAGDASTTRHHGRRYGANIKLTPRSRAHRSSPIPARVTASSCCTCTSWQVVLLPNALAPPSARVRSAKNFLCAVDHRIRPPEVLEKHTTKESRLFYLFFLQQHTKKMPVQDEAAHDVPPVPAATSAAPLTRRVI
jgi:hypothetical protein